jgi:hypothetical protein
MTSSPSDQEFSALVQDHPAVARLETNDALRQRAESAESQLAYMTECYERAENDLNAQSKAREGAESRVAELARELQRWERGEVFTSCPGSPFAALQASLATEKQAREAAEREVKEARKQIDRVITLRLASEYHEDYSTVLWWNLPVCEPPAVDGVEVPDGYTHFSHLPIVWDGDGSALKLSGAARSASPENPQEPASVEGGKDAK